MDPVLQPVLDDLAAWAKRKQRRVDLALLEQALDLRLEHDGMGDNHWPAGSVRHLMLERYPVSGPVSPPDAVELVATLDTFWRFLRSDGRMNARSASPAELLGEAKKAAKTMPAACAEPRALAAREMVAGSKAVALAQQTAAGGDLEWRTSAADFRSSGLWRSLRRLVQWVSDGPDGARELDRLGDLPLPQVRELWDLLELGVWTGHFLSASFQADQPPALVASGVASVASWDESWAEQSDCMAVDRLWWVAVRCGLVAVDDGWARATFVEPSDAQGWVELGVAVVFALAEWASYETSLQALLLVLGMVTPPEGTRCTLRELVQAWVDEVRADLLELGIEDRTPLDEAGWDLVQGMAMFDDANLWQRVGRVEGTAFGADFHGVLAAALDESGQLLQRDWEQPEA